MRFGHGGKRTKSAHNNDKITIIINIIIIIKKVDLAWLLQL